MAEVMTSVRLPGLSGNAGLADYGRVTPVEMIAKLRAYAIAMKRDAEAILAATDDDFRVETYRGVHVQRDLVVLQDGREIPW